MAVAFYHHHHHHHHHRKLNFRDFGLNFDYSSIIFGNEKLAMQDLNRRLAIYMKKVLNLDSGNHKLDQKIKEFCKHRALSGTKDLSKYYKIIEDLQKQIITMTKEKNQVAVTLDNAKLEANEFRMKFENERNICQTIDADMVHLRVFLGELKMRMNDLNFHMSGLKEELVFLKKSHEEDLHMVRTQSGSLNVEIDCGPAVDLAKELQEMREQYEALLLKNKKKIEQWYLTKQSKLNTEVFQCHTEITTSQKVISDLNKTYQKLQIEINGIHTQIEILRNELVQVGIRDSQKVSQLQLYIDELQTELDQIKARNRRQAKESSRLEQEIAEYRRLLGGEIYQCNIQEVDTTQTAVVSKTVTQTVVETKEETKEIEEHHVYQKRVKVITENLVDGVVVSSSTAEKMEDMALEQKVNSV